jgi:peptide/nickel transport system permease protein
MTLLKEFILPRIAQWFAVVFVGVDGAFMIPRLSPVNPVDQAVGRVTAFQTMDPKAAVRMRQTLEDLYGLEGSTFEQYVSFWKRVLKGDLGPSFSAFPTPVNEMIGNAIGWTIGLLGTSIIISWVLGIVLGSVAGYFPNRFSSQVVDKLLIIVYPVPYYILALVLLMIFTYYWPIFPLVGGARGSAEYSWKYISSLLHHSFLPALSIVIGATAFRYIMAKALTFGERSSDYVRYAEMAAVPKHKILLFYGSCNTMLPQVTDLGLSLGTIFRGRDHHRGCLRLSGCGERTL